MVVKVSLVTTVHDYADPLTVQEVAPLNDPVLTKFFDVMILREDPALVLKLGVTVKEIELSPVCMAVNLLG